MKNKKINTNLLTDVEVYKLVLEGELKKFPLYFWTKPYSFESAKNITKYLIEDIFNWNDEEIKVNISQKMFVNYKLNGMLQKVFNGSPFLALDNAYPNEFKQWELKNTPLSFWTEENCYKAIKWLIEEKLKLSDREIKKQYSKEFLINNGLVTVTHTLKEDSYTIINKLYPNQFKAWEFNQTPIEFWDNETIVDAMRWFIEEKMQWNKEDIRKKLTIDIIERNGLSGLIIYIGKNNIGIFDLINMTYPNTYKEWELNKINKWTKKKSIEATQWLIESKLKWDIQKTQNKITNKYFYEYGLSGMLTHSYRGSVYLALKDAYPLENWEMLISKFKKLGAKNNEN